MIDIAISTAARMEAALSAFEALCAGGVDGFETSVPDAFRVDDLEVYLFGDFVGVPVGDLRGSAAAQAFSESRGALVQITRGGSLAYVGIIKRGVG